MTKILVFLRSLDYFRSEHGGGGVNHVDVQARINPFIFPCPAYQDSQTRPVHQYGRSAVLLLLPPD